MQLPKKDAFWQFMWTGSWLTVLFVVIYGYTNWRADQIEDKFIFYFDWELTLPLVPWLILPYISLNLLTASPLFVMRPNEMRGLGRSLALSTVVAGICFWFFPAPIGYTRPAGGVPGWDWFFQLVWSLDRVNNTLPSLHITYAAITIFAIWGKISITAKIIFGLWFAVICVAVELTWQHHILDIVSGIALAWGCHRLVGKAFGPDRFSWKM